MRAPPGTGEPLGRFAVVRPGDRSGSGDGRRSWPLALPEETLHAEPRLGRHPQNGRVTEEGKPVGDSLADLEPALGVEQVPLVEQDHDRAARGVDPLGEALVLVSDTFGRIEDEQSHVGTVERSQCPHQRVVLRPLTASCPAAHPGGVDELDCSVVGLDHGVDGVPHVECPGGRGRRSAPRPRAG